ERGGAGGKATWRRMFHDSAAGVVFERVRGEQCAFQVEQVVEAEFLAAFLYQSRQSYPAMLHIKCGTLARLFAIPERLRAIETDRDPFWEEIITLRSEPSGNGAIVRGGVLEHFCRQIAPECFVVLAVLE